MSPLIKQLPGIALRNIFIPLKHRYARAKSADRKVPINDLLNGQFGSDEPTYPTLIAQSGA
jgi:hypothetical protein